MTAVLLVHMPHIANDVATIAVRLGAAGSTVTLLSADDRPFDAVLQRQLDMADCVVSLWSDAAVQSLLFKDIALAAMNRGNWVSAVFDSSEVPYLYRVADAVDLTAWSTDPDTGFRALLSHISSRQQTQENSDTLSQRIARRVIAALAEDQPAQGRTAAARQEPMNFHLKIGDWTVDPATNSVTSASASQSVRTQSMNVLVYLAEHASRPVPVPELLEALWGQRVVVDSVVHGCIRELRVALNDDFREPRYISTIPRRGYRLTAPVTIQPR